jgi:beta-galactosidase GanA
MLEPQEGQFDFALIDGMLKQARTHEMKVVLLWFGSWKNSMSSYAPSWVKRDPLRFPRAVNQEGKSQEILTPFHPNNLAADRAAYSALMRHLKKTDSKDHTVIMVQVENEIGMLPSARDYYSAANTAFKLAVPQKLMTYLQQHKTQLVPEIYQSWQKNGFKTTGNWTEIFGPGLATDEIFIAWYFARYTNEIAAAGKAIYPLPTYINAALNRPNVLPGDYPGPGAAGIRAASQSLAGPC